MTEPLLREGDQDREPGTDCSRAPPATPAGTCSPCRPGEGLVRRAGDPHSNFPRWKLLGFPQRWGTCSVCLM